ncbi:MAG: acyltransferase family protein [Geminicoccales bacterium]
MIYRKEIDGLRAVAILPVLLFHAGFESASGGFVGVDVFFVISGYLITSLILKEKEEGRFTLVGFYERRARRILPALFFVMLCCLPFAWLWLLPSDLDDLADSMIGVALFVSNIHFYREAGYFTPDANLQPLLHSWSLSIEEQFYLLFPLLVMGLWSLGKKSLVSIIACVFLLSLLTAQFGHHWLFSGDPAFGFYLLPTRAWELLAGVLAAFHLHGRDGTWKGSQALSLLGLGMIVYAILSFDEGTPHPSFYTLLPVVGTVLIILFATTETRCAQLLSTRLLVGLGLISYSVYLWHQPLFAFLRLLSLETPSPTMLFLFALLALALGWLSWRWVEQPFRDRQRISRAQIFKGSAIGSVFFLSIGIAGNEFEGFLERYPPSERDLALAADTDKMGRYVYSRYKPYKDQPFKENGRRKVLIVGDSFAQDFVNMLAEAEGLRNISLSIHEIASPCGNLYLKTDFKDHIQQKHLPGCLKKGWYERDDLQSRLKQADAIVLVSSWSLWAARLLPTSVDNLEREFDAKVLVVGRKYFGDIKPAHYFDMSDQEKLAYRQSVEGGHLETNRLMASQYSDDVFVDVHDVICGPIVDCPIFTPDLKLISYDGSHLTREGAVYLGKKLLKHPLVEETFNPSPLRTSSLKGY